MKRKGLAHVLFVLVRVCATAAFLFYGNILLGRLFEWTPFGFPIWNFASACAACLASLIAFVVLMEVLWGRNGSRVACVFCGAVPLLLVAEPFIAAADLCDQQAEWTGAAVGLFALPVFVVLFRKAGTLVPGRFRRPAPADATKPALWALFLVCLLLPPFPSPVLGLVFRMLHGLDVYDTGNVMDARGGPWPFFAMRDATFVLLPAFAVLFAFAVRRFRPRTAVAVALALAPTSKVGDSVGEIYQTMGIGRLGAPGTTAAVMMLNDAVKKGGSFASSSVGGLSGAFIPVMEDHAMSEAVTAGTLTLEKLEAMTSVCSVGLDMILVPGDTPAETIAGLYLDEAAIGVTNRKTTGVRVIPVPGAGPGEFVDFGGLFGYGTVVAPACPDGSAGFVRHGGHIPAPIHSLSN